MRIRSQILPVLMLASTVAFAQPEVASQLFDEGRELAKQGKWEEACVKFSGSLARDPAPGTKLNLGECLEMQGKVRASWLLYLEAARDLERMNDARAPLARERAAASEAKLATLVIQLAGATRPGIAVKVGERPVSPQAEIVERIDPGSVQVTVTAPGAKPFTQAIATTSGQTSVVDVPELIDVPAPIEPPKPVTVTTTVTTRQRKRVYIAYALGATGVGSLIASGVLGLLARSQYRDAFDSGKCFDPPSGPPVCTPEGQTQTESAGVKADAGTGFLVAGVALVAAGVVVYLTAPKEHGVAVAPVATSSTVGAQLQLSF